MKKIGLLAMILGLVISGAAIAGDAEVVTIEGKVMCAKCALHEEGREKCQNVLAVESDDADTVYYYLAANETNAEFGEVCMATPSVRVTGTVEEKDGKNWLVATVIEPVEAS
ncbi:MAG: DUF6370 family protein [Acidobacteriota bacterium]|nr:DUF6370 family protein [Acidobacteriota bacterium]MDH3783830.1 DUF6370 family protein [Acidobacteriota bacterium]